MDFNLLFVFVLILKVAATTNFTGRKFSEENNLRNLESFGIAGGKNVTINKIRYIGTAYTKNSPIGSVVILNKRWALTAAFNLAGEEEIDLKYRFGSSFNNRGGILIEPAKTFTYSNYSGNWDYDIALIKLKKDLKFSKKIKSISIGSSLPKNGTRVLITGFGGDDNNYFGTATLKKVMVTYIDFKTCKTYYPSAEDVTNLSFCTSDADAGPCSYDWGSPLVYKNKLIGIFSGSLACANTKYPPVYLDVTKFREWIQQTIKNN